MELRCDEGEAALLEIKPNFTVRPKKTKTKKTKNGEAKKKNGEAKKTKQKKNKKKMVGTSSDAGALCVAFFAQ